MQPTGKVTLVGAGPGDPRLITLLGLAKLQAAQTVFYDALIHIALLEHCNPETEKVFVGKRAGASQLPQMEIHERMIAAARLGKAVVRLKGGDPYLFGRGSEEVEALAQAGIPFEVIPGVSSPMAAAAYAGISLTHREYASSVAYVTASESLHKGASSHDWAKLATATQTLVVFMGLHKLADVVEQLLLHGRPPQTPAAIIQWASLPYQKTVVGTLETLVDAATQAGINRPALTIIGEVVRLRQTLSWFEQKPLFGKRVLVTRMAHQTTELADALRDRGAEPILLPTIRLAAPEDVRPLQKAIHDLKNYSWIIFTSANGVERFFAELKNQHFDARQLSHARICAIGPATGDALHRQGLVPDVVPKEYVGEAVVTALAQAHGASLHGVRILLPRAARARDVIPTELQKLGATVDVVPSYQTLPADESIQTQIRTAFAENAIDVVLLTSASTVENLVDLMGSKVSQLQNAVLACIGPIATARACELGLHVHVTASVYTTQGLLDSLESFLAAKPT